MGWLWASSSAPKDASNEKTTAAPPPAATSPPESQYSDPEIAKFMAQLHAEFGSKPSESAAETPSPSTKPTIRHPRAGEPPPSTWGSLWGTSAQSAATLPSSSSSSPEAVGRSTNAAQESAGTPPREPGLLDPISESLLPTTMSCRQALDAAFYCQSPGGQWNAVYREGSVRSCSAHWEDLFFCLRTRNLGDGPAKRAAIREHYRKKEVEKYGGGRPSSTDVWEAREDKVEPGTAFRETYERPTIGDEEWRVLEIERRRMVQEALSREEGRAP